MPMRTVVVTVAAMMFTACDGQGGNPLPLVGTLERDRIALVAEAAEPIVEVGVTEGDTVDAAQVLMRLDDARAAAELRRLAAERDAAAQRLAELVRGPRAESIREAQARLTGAQDNLAVQSREYRRVEDLVERGMMAEFALDRARNDLETATAEVDSLRAALDALIVGTTPEELGQAQARLDAAEAALDAQRIRLDRLTIRAPRPGRIESLPLKLGAHPRVGDTVVNMLADQAPYARVYVPETLLTRVQPGTQAEVVVDGRLERFAARVRYVASDAAFTPYYALTERDRGRLSFLAEITLLDPAAEALPSGVGVEVDFPGLRE